MDLLRDPIWTFVGVAVTAVLTIISLGFAQRWQGRKKISYEVISNTPVLTVRPDMRHRVKITFDGKAVSDVNLLTIKLWNSGNVPIQHGDYEKPLTFHFGKDAKILSAGIFDPKPGNIPATLTQDKNGLTVQPMLLNAGDSIKLAILISQFNEKNLDVDTRIAGVKRATESKPAISERAFKPIAFTLIVVSNIIGYYILDFGRNAVTLQISAFFLGAGFAASTTPLWLRRLRTIWGVITWLIIASSIADVGFQITAHLLFGH